MSIIGVVGRNSKKVKALNFSIHIILLLGSITMIYPFLMMVSASFKSSVDSKSFSIYPKYFFEEDMLLKKYTEARMNEESHIFIEQYKNNFIAFEYLSIPRDPNENKYSDWRQFLNETSNQHNVYDYYK